MSLGPIPGALQSRNRLLGSTAHQILLFVSFVLFVVNSHWH